MLNLNILLEETLVSFLSHHLELTTKGGFRDKNDGFNRSSFSRNKVNRSRIYKKTKINRISIKSIFA